MDRDKVLESIKDPQERHIQALEFRVIDLEAEIEKYKKEFGQLIVDTTYNLENYA